VPSSQFVIKPIPEIIRPGHRNGRHVFHDPRSLRFLAAPAGVAVEPETVVWERHTPTYDQGRLGSCTTNTGIENLGCDPFWDSLGADFQAILTDAARGDEYAVDLYREVTRNDPFPGQYEPNDTGSDGLSVAKRVKARDLISGYTHATSFPAFLAAIKQGPVAVGTVWLSGMETPDAEGIVRVAGTEEGGHEWTVREVDAERELVWGDNHWTENWGRRGRFAVPFADFQRLLGMQGDVTAFVPADQPAPTPGPVSPVEPSPIAPDGFPVEQVEPWIDGVHRTRREKVAAKAIEEWLSRRGQG
jgi:hypothetical protein